MATNDGNLLNNFGYHWVKTILNRKWTTFSKDFQHSSIYFLCILFWKNEKKMELFIHLSQSPQISSAGTIFCVSVPKFSILLDLPLRAASTAWACWV